MENRDMSSTSLREIASSGNREGRDLWMPPRWDTMDLLPPGLSTTTPWSCTEGDQLQLDTRIFYRIKNEEKFLQRSTELSNQKLYITRLGGGECKVVIKGPPPEGSPQSGDIILFERTMPLTQLQKAYPTLPTNSIPYDSSVPVTFYLLVGVGVLSVGLFSLVKVSKWIGGMCFSFWKKSNVLSSSELEVPPAQPLGEAAQPLGEAAQPLGEVAQEEGGGFGGGEEVIPVDSIVSSVGEFTGIWPF